MNFILKGLIFISLLFGICGNVYAEVEYFCNKAMMVEHIDFNKYNVYTKQAEGYKLISKESNSQVVCHSENLVEIKTSCGSPCSYSIFYNPKTYQTSDSFFLVIAVNPKNQKIAIEGEGDHKYQLEIRDIFSDSGKTYIKRNFSQAAVFFNVITVEEFTDDSIKINYSEGPDFKEKIETIPLNEGQ
jgi:hypothetical protein